MMIEQEIGKIFLENNLTISTAESCTGGLLSSMLTDVAGSSAFISLNVITYANEIKHKILGVSQETLTGCGAVSEECAKEMVIGLKKLTDSDICVATTGIAGPGGGTNEKPVGLCYVGVFLNGEVRIKKLLFDSKISRKELKQKFATAALEFVKDCLELC